MTHIKKDKVAIVIISHSPDVASGAAEMVKQMSGQSVPVVAVGGDFEGGLGTNVEAIHSAYEEVYCDEGVLVIYDLGSAEMSAETAREFLDQEKQEKIIISHAPLVEGAVLAGAVSAGGGTLEEVKSAAEKKTDTKEILHSSEGNIQSVKIRHKIGLHARPAVRFTEMAKGFKAEIGIKLENQSKWVDAKSIVRVMSLKARNGQILNLKAEGKDANQAINALIEFVQNSFGEEQSEIE